MDSRRVLFFLELLTTETKGNEGTIAELYNRALDENDDIQRLKTLLNDYTFYHEIGNSLYKDGKELLNRIYSSPTKALDILPELKQAHESIENEVKISERLIKSPLPFTENVTVLKQKDTYAYMQALRMIASTSIYLMLIYAGLEQIKDLTWNDTVGIQEMIYAVNTKFLPALSSTKRPNYSWIIRKRKLGGKALFGGTAFFLSYETSQNVELLCNSLHKEPMGTHAFLNINAYESGELDVPFCWGIGNIISAMPHNALTFLQRSITTKVRSPQLSELSRKMPTPFECVKQLTDNTMFCITPDELLLAMNQWETGHEIVKRKATSNCLFCGKHVDGNRLVCQTHFSSEVR